MEVIKDFLAEYYWIFLIVGVILLIVLIGFISSTKKKKQTEVAANTPESAQEPQPTQEVVQPQVQPMPVNETPQDTFEPSLDSFSSTATEVNVGFNQTAPQEMATQANNVQTIQQPIEATPVATLTIEEKPSVAINTNDIQPVQPAQNVNQSEPIMAEPQVGLVIEDKPSVSTNTQAPQVQPMVAQSVNQPEPVAAEPQVGLVIEDKPSVSTNTQTPQVQPMVAQSVNQADPIEAEPTIGLVIEDTGKTVGTTIN